MNSRTHARLPGLVALTLGLAVGLSPATSFADDTPAVSSEAQAHHTVFDFEFPGGSLSSCVDQLRGMDPSINILVQDNASDFPVPAMNLNKVNVKACIWTLNQLRVENEINTRELYSDEFVVVGGSPVIVLSSSTSFRRPPAQRNSRGKTASVPGIMQTEVMSVGALLSSGFTPDMILNDLKQMRSLSGDSEQGSDKAVIDTQTGLLMIHGDEFQVAQAWELLAALEDSTSYRLELQRSEQQDQQSAVPAAEPRGQVALRLMTLEQLKGMSTKELRARMVRISQARQGARENVELMEQLKSQFELTMEALKSKGDE